MADDIPLILADHPVAGSGIPDMSGDVPVNLGDVDVDVDDVDLFGGPVELSLPSHPPPSKQLQIRVNEQRIRGCNQYVSRSFFSPKGPMTKLTRLDALHGRSRALLPPLVPMANP